MYVMYDASMHVHQNEYTRYKKSVYINSMFYTILCNMIWTDTVSWNCKLSRLRRSSKVPPSSTATVWSECNPSKVQFLVVNALHNHQLMIPNYKQYFLLLSSINSHKIRKIDDVSLLSKSIPFPFPFTSTPSRPCAEGPKKSRMSAQQRSVSINHQYFNMDGSYHPEKGNKHRKLGVVKVVNCSLNPKNLNSKTY